MKTFTALKIAAPATSLFFCMLFIRTFPYAQHHLPVAEPTSENRIYNFNITAQGKQVTLSWQYYGEDPNTNLLVERSIDGQIYELLSLTPYPVMSNQVFYYRDELAQNGVYYYRVKIYGSLGGGHYSEVKTVTITESKEESQVKIIRDYNTNTESPITISFPTSTIINVKIQICDINGRLQYSYSGNANEMPAIGSLATGIYFINAIYGRNAYSEKIAIP